MFLTPQLPKCHERCNLQINTVIFDKTGTVTYGVPHVEKIVLLGKDQSSTARRKLLAIIGTAESCSEHPIAGAIVSHAKKVNNQLIGTPLAMACPELVQF